MYFKIIKKNLPNAFPIYLYANDAIPTGGIAAVDMHGNIARVARVPSLNEAEVALTFTTLTTSGYNEVVGDGSELEYFLTQVPKTVANTIIGTDFSAYIDSALCYVPIPAII